MSLSKKYSGTSVAPTQKNIQNVLELSEDWATEVPKFQAEKLIKSDSDEGQFHNAMINNWCPGQWLLEVKERFNP